MASKENAERIEWIAGSVSALVVLRMIGFFVYEAISGADGLPRREVTVDLVDQIAGGTHLRYLIRNEGGGAAALKVGDFVVAIGNPFGLGSPPASSAP